MKPIKKGNKIPNKLFFILKAQIRLLKIHRNDYILFDPGTDDVYQNKTVIKLYYVRNTK